MSKAMRPVLDFRIADVVRDHSAIQFRDVDLDQIDDAQLELSIGVTGSEDSPPMKTMIACHE